MIVGVGGRAQAPADALTALVAKALADVGRTLTDVRTVSTLDRKADHEGVRRLLGATGADLAAWPADRLAAQPVQHPSARVARHVGTPSVAEAAVLAAGGDTLGDPVAADGWVVVLGTPSEPDLLHHGDTEVEPGMLDFAVNVHATEPPPFLRDALVAAIADLAGYPDPTAATAAVAAAHGVAPECVLLTHGAAEAFTLLARQPWRRPVVVHPQFTEPEAALVAAGHRPDRLLLDRADGFRLTRLPAADADLVIVGNPTNPTSRLHRVEEIAALASETESTDRIVVIDEAFLDAVENPAEPQSSLVRRAAEDRRFIVVRSLTKTYSIAGLRIGYLVGHPDRIAALAAGRTPWAVSSLAAAAAIACVSPEGRRYAAEVRAALPARLAHLAQGLADHGFEVVPEPRAPFVLARHREASAIRNRLRTQGIAVRRGDTFPGLGREWLRFAARDAAATDVLLSAFRQSSAPRR